MLEDDASDLEKQLAKKRAPSQGKEQAGGMLAILGAMILWGFPAVAGLIGRLGGDAGLVLAECGLLGVSVGIYALALPTAGRAFTRRAEEMRGLCQR